MQGCTFWDLVLGSYESSGIIYEDSEPLNPGRVRLSNEGVYGIYLRERTRPSLLFTWERVRCRSFVVVVLVFSSQAAAAAVGRQPSGCVGKGVSPACSRYSLSIGILFSPTSSPVGLIRAPATPATSTKFGALIAPARMVAYVYDQSGRRAFEFPCVLPRLAVYPSVTTDRHNTIHLLACVYLYFFAVPSSGRVRPSVQARTTRLWR